MPYPAKIQADGCLIGLVQIMVSPRRAFLSETKIIHPELPFPSRPVG